MAGWSVAQAPDLAGRTAVVTGATSGIGRETARALARRGAHVVIGARDPARGEAAAAAIRSEAAAGGSVTTVPLDLADLASIGAFATRVLAEEARLDLLVNNAGVMMTPPGRTVDGFDVQFGTNHLGTFALTGRLLPLILATADARVVTVSSLAHRGARIPFDDLGFERHRRLAYGASKLANLLFTNELARRFAAAGRPQRAIAAHPGWTYSGLARHSRMMDFVHRLVGQDAETGALPTLRAALDPQASNGDYYGPAGRLGMRGPPIRAAAGANAHDTAAAARLWQVSESLTGVDYRID